MNQDHLRCKYYSIKFFNLSQILHFCRKHNAKISLQPKHNLLVHSTIWQTTTTTKEATTEEEPRKTIEPLKEPANKAIYDCERVVDVQYTSAKLKITPKLPYHT